MNIRVAVPITGFLVALSLPCHTAPGSSRPTSSEAAQPRLTLDLQQTPLIEVLLLLQKQSHKRLVWETEIKDKVTARLLNVTLEQALDFLLTPKGYGWTSIDAREDPDRSQGYRIFHLEKRPDVVPTATGLRLAYAVPLLLNSNEWRCSAVDESGWDRVEFDASRWEAPTIIVEDGQRPEMGLSLPGTDSHKSVCFRNAFTIPLTGDAGGLRSLPIKIWSNGKFTVKVNGAVLARGERIGRRFDLGQAVVDGANVLAVKVEVASPETSPLLQVRWSFDDRSAASGHLLPSDLVASCSDIVWKRVPLKRLDPLQMSLLINQAIRGVPGRLSSMLQPFADINMSVLPERTLAVGGKVDSVDSVSRLLTALDGNDRWRVHEIPCGTPQLAKQLMEGVQRTQISDPIFSQELLSLFCDESRSKLLVFGTESAIKLLQEMLSRPLPKRQA